MSAAPVPDDAMEVNMLCEEQIDQPDVEAFLEATRLQPRCSATTDDTLMTLV